MRDLDDAAYVPGTWVAISAANGCLLVDLVAADPVVRRCWKLLTEDAGVDAVLDALAAGGVAGAPSFALVVRTRAGHRAVVRHPASLTVHGNGHDQVDVDSTAGTSWTDILLADTALDAVTLAGARSDASVELPMGAGVTMASVVHLRPGTPAETPAETANEGPPRPVPFPRDGEAVAVAVPLPAAPADSPRPQPIAVDPAEADTAETDESYDHLFGASTQRPLAPPPPPPPFAPPTATPEPPFVPVTGHTAGWHTEVPAPQVPPPAAPLPQAEGLIEGVPWAQAGSAPPAVPAPRAVAESAPDAATTAIPAVPAVESESSDYGATVNRAQLRADALAAAGPTVLAGRCPNGHLSPPHADRCRVCRAPMPEQDAFEIGRPVLGALRLQSGDLVTLDRGVLLGRSPDVPSGLDRPHVLRLKSADNDISRNHAEVVLDGWNVSVRDLGSTNGTVVQLPGRAPVRLRENEPALLESGAIITLADEVAVVFEVQA